MALAHFRMLIHEFLNKDSGIVPKEDPLLIFDSKSAVCMYNNGKDNKHTSHIPRTVHFVRNGWNSKMHNIYWCEWGLQLADIATKNVGENDINPRMNIFMVSLVNWDRTLAQYGWKDTWKSIEQEFCMNKLDLVEDSTQSVWNVCIKFYTWK